MAAKGQAVRWIAVASLFMMVIPKLLLWNSVRSSLLCASAGTSSNLFILRVGTTVLAAVGDSFCFPLMEKDLMGSGLSNILESAQDLSQKAFVAARYAAR